MARKAFGGMTIDMTHCSHTGAQIFGKDSPSGMTKRMWVHFKKCGKIHKG